MKKALIVAYYFPPLGWSGVQRTLKYVKYLREFGWEPIVITVGKSKFSVLDESLLDEIPKGIEVIRIDDVKFKDITDELKEILRGYTKYSFDFISNEYLKNKYETEIEKVFESLRNLFLVPDGNAIWVNKVISEIDKRIDINTINLVYTTSAPYSAHLVGYYLKTNYMLPWVADFRDEWTNNPYISYTKNTRYDLEKHMEETLLNSCNKIVTISNIAKSNYINNFNIDEKKVEVITNGYDEEDFSHCSESEKNNKFTIIYNGTFYLDIKPYTFIKAINNLINSNMINTESIEIKFIGKIDKEIKLEAQLRDTYKLIKFANYMTHIESLKESLKGDLLLLITGKREEVKSVYTGKVFEYLRLKKPILALTPKDSVIEKLLEETSCGINAEYDDIESIENIIFKYYSDWKNDEKFIVNEDKIKKYERKKLTKNLAKVFDEVLRDN